MKAFLKTAVAAAVVVGVAAQPHHHGHHHFHAKRHAKSVAEKRDTVVHTEYVEGPTVVEYVLPDGKKVDSKEAEKGIEEGVYVVMGSTKPTFTPPPPSVTTSVGNPEHGGQFFEVKATPQSTPSASPTPAPKPKEKPKPQPPADNGPKGLDADFPSGKLRCDKVPTEYGAVEIPWSTTNGWTTRQKMGKWIKGVAFDNFAQPIDGTCSPGEFCSYACPPGYQKTQWPEEQGATGQSVGGLWCNEDGFLELTRPSHPKLCEPGAGGVFVRNELSKGAAICRTDYPGNENMIIPVDTQPGGTYPLTNPDQRTYYMWKGMPTSAQYYVNPLGIPVAEACIWESSKHGHRVGNWAPINIGVGKAADGITYISIFPNKPTTTAKLDFDIAIEGDINGECWLKNDAYPNNNPDGCTTGMREGGKATIVFKNRA
ncbi:hypothetical protein VTJ83DRAFT_1971 [Remersonia thermophila]|uniref:Murein transglycosylase n=1 Tax=Remersonia thermophila TaxID=72144 RepID=A0ABR4DHQ5_9PEZI